MAGDSISQQKEIFGKVQSLMAFLDTTEQNKKRENLEEWKEVLESLRDITSNPLPFLLELLKNVQIGKNVKKKYAEARAMRAARCCCDEIKFYNINTMETIWDYSDVVITADKEIISCKPENKKRENLEEWSGKKF